MTNFEDIFDLALSRLKAGENLQEIVTDYPEHQSELLSLLEVAQSGFSISKLTPPAPYKRQLYQTQFQSSWTASLFHFSKMAAVPIALVAVFFGGRVVVDATATSLPGDTLYSLKRATEEARLTLTRNPEKLASMHVELMQKRVNEVRQATGNGNIAVEAKAIEELKTQTNKTFAEVAPVATATAISKQDSSLLDELLAVNKEQKDALADVTNQEENTEAKVVATTYLEETKKNDQTLAKIIATVNDQTLVDLPNKISITGTISAHVNNRVTVEKNTFLINDKTSITDVNSELLSVAPDLTLKGRATIIGVKTNGVLIAMQIILLPEEDGEVKGDVAPKPAPAPAKPPVKPTAPAPAPAPTPTPAPAPAPAPTSPEPNKATGSYITEPSSSQYTF